MLRCTFLEEKQQVVHLNVYETLLPKSRDIMTKMQFASAVRILFYCQVM